MPVQGRKFCGILYVESDTYKVDDVLEHIKSYFDQWAYCLHDKDVHDETGEIKKAHFHWVGSVKNPVQVSTISNALGVPSNYIEFVRKKGNADNWKGAVRYLVHASNPEKYQYDVQSVISNFDVTRYINAYDETQQMVKIVGFIRENPYCTFEQVFDFAVMNGCYSEFRRGAYIINKIMIERLDKKMKLIGIQRVDYTNKNGYHVMGCRLHTSVPAKTSDSIGEITEVIFVPEMVFETCDQFNVGDEISVSYNKYGKVTAVSVIG